MKIIFTTILLFGFQLIYAQGIKFDKEKYENLPEYKVNSQGFSSTNFPSKISYRAYCPQVLSQGQVSTCVGWATSYAMLTTQQNILMGETNEVRKSVRSMDPNFVYSMIRNYNDKWCQDGTYMWEALEVVLNYGSKPYFAPPWLSCNSTTEIDKFALAVSSYYSANKYYALTDKSNIVSSIKVALNEKNVVSVGLNVTSSFSAGNGVKLGKWTPLQNESITGGHAMCIVGYDDSKFGGSFELMNSYGTNFGDKGFVWVTYSDIKKYLNEAYIIELNSGTTGFRKGNCTLGNCNSTYSRYKYNTGEVYEGEFSNGYRNGWGILLQTDNSFYIGGFSNGYKHGWGIYYISSTGKYLKTYFNYGTLQSSQNYQGFSGSSEDKKLDNLIEVFNGILPGNIIDINSEDYLKIFNSFQPENEPIQIEK